MPGICGLEKSLFARGGNYFWGDRRKRDFLGIEKSGLCRAGRSFSLEVIMADIKQDHGSYVVKAKLEQETKDEAPKVLTGYLRGFMR